MILPMDVIPPLMSLSIPTYLSGLGIFLNLSVIRDKFWLRQQLEHACFYRRTPAPLQLN
jgi:hypothetical protein